LTIGVNKNSALTSGSTLLLCLSVLLLQNAKVSPKIFGHRITKAQLFFFLNGKIKAKTGP
jgi:hypothetical protein